MKFDSVVFADTAPLAALSCFSRLKSERDAGRKALILTLVNSEGGAPIGKHGLGSVRSFDEVEADGDATGSTDPWRERVSSVIRRLGARHVMAPLGLLSAPQAIDYFTILRAAISIDHGRDLLFFEERPECLAPWSVLLRLSGMGARLPPVSQLRSSRRYAPFFLKMVTGLGVPPIFGALRDRARLARSLRVAFRESCDWDPHRALGPKLQPVVEPWQETDTVELFALASELGQERRLGSLNSFNRRMARHGVSGGSRAPIERYWLSLPTAEELDPAGDSY